MSGHITKKNVCAKTKISVYVCQSLKQNDKSLRMKGECLVCYATCVCVYSHVCGIIGMLRVRGTPAYFFFSFFF